VPGGRAAGPHCQSGSAGTAVKNFLHGVWLGHPLHPVLTDVPQSARIMTEEPFGPVAPIVTFKTFDEVVQRANSLEFGLAAYTFTSSPKTATAIGDALQSGMVGVNSVAISTPETPFGGIKDSGYGHEGGIEGLEVYMNKKFIAQA